ncbi:MAG: hypothetical protein EOO59_06920 [Hymenobacter sp.]|nr:MAG: hypothetical protein EOO59_06920 [Hymenobacter sp.]
MPQTQHILIITDRAAGARRQRRQRLAGQHFLAAGVQQYCLQKKQLLVVRLIFGVRGGGLHGQQPGAHRGRVAGAGLPGHLQRPVVEAGKRGGIQPCRTGRRGGGGSRASTRAG